MANLKPILYCPHKPTPKQILFLSLQTEEALYGGAAGGGKSDALLMAALQYVDVPGYAALLLRRTFKALTLPEALLDRSRMWLGGTDAKWHGDSTSWVFPSGAKVTFGYLEHDTDVYQYQSAAFQFIGFDETTQFTEYQYRYMHSRTRRLAGSNVPIRVRGASNPGGVGHEWVKQRFIVEGKENNRPFIPATLKDNPFLDQEQYIKSLNNLDPITRQQLLEGDWSARATSIFKREWFEIVDKAPEECHKIRYWDMASTEPTKDKDPDWTAGCLMGVHKGIIYLIDMRHFRGTPGANESLVKQTAELDGRNVVIRMEQEPGSSGVKVIDDYRRRVLLGWNFAGDKVTGNKLVRANPLASQAQAGNVKLVRGQWINAFLDECEIFPNGSHDDMVDAASGALSQLTGVGTATVIWI